jgi:DNA repair protein SbcD/Mre11
VPFRFVHTADLHLDSPLRTLALRDPGLAALIGSATRGALTRIVDLCLAEAVDALVIAGDLYDGAQTSMKTARFLVQELARLEAAGIRVFLIRGNHDAASRITRELILPPGVHVFGPRAGTLVIETGARPVALHGISFRDPQAPESLLGRFPPPVAGAWNIGLLHSSLGGAAGHDPYAPCSVAELDAMGFDYWALGHIHRREVWRGRATVVMPGMPQGRDIGEAGAKSVTLVTLGDDGRVTLAERPTATARFDRLAVDLSGLTDWRKTASRIEHALQAARRALPEEQIVLRLDLQGATPLAPRIRRDIDLLAEQAAAAADAIGTIWIDGVHSACTAPADPLGAGAVAELARLMAQAGHDPATRLRATEETAALAKALPRALRDLFGADPEAADTLRDQLLQEGAAEVLALLSAAPDDMGEDG